MTSFCISLWNIQGLNSSLFGLKSRNPEFLKEIRQIDLLILQETWCRGDEPTGCPPGYKELVVPSTKSKGVTQGRNSGGMLIWFKSELIHSIKPIKQAENKLWLKISKETLSTPQNVFLCAIYIPPLESPYFCEETFPNLEKEIIHFQSKGHIIICGDLNARTGDQPDFICNQGDHFITGGNVYFPSQHSRENSDKGVNTHGKNLLQLCRSLGLYIINGRLRGDTFGRLTHSSALGSSTVDYSITDLDLSYLRAFTVQPLTPLSDHSPITLYLNKTVINNHQVNSASKMYRLKQSPRWEQDSTEKYSQAINSQAVQTQLNSFMLNSFPQNKVGVDMAVESLNMVFKHSVQLINLNDKKKQSKKV